MLVHSVADLTAKVLESIMHGYLTPPPCMIKLLQGAREISEKGPHYNLGHYDTFLYDAVHVVLSSGVAA